MQIELKELESEQRLAFWQLAFSDSQAEWTKWNGPYFHDVLPTQTEFMAEDRENKYVQNPLRKVIWADGEMVGLVTAYYEDEPLNQWLDVGITVYRQTQWHQGIGHAALQQWITELFDQIALPHLGLTTWSGNQRMIKLAERLHLHKEAEVRQVRYWQGKYWNSVKYGVLRFEWETEVEDR